MRIAIAGYTGFLGSNVSAHFTNYGWEVLIISRAELFNISLLADRFKKVDVVINFCGAPISKRWTAPYKAILHFSRINITQNIISAILLSGNDKLHFLNASAIGIYDVSGIHDESSMRFDSGFLGKLVFDWEQVVNISDMNPNRYSLLRFGLVTDRRGGFLNKLLLPLKIKTFVRFGKPSNFISFIDLYDFLQALIFIIEHKLNGIINIVAPNVCTQFDVENELSKLFKPWLKFRIPVFVLRIVFGEGFYVLLGTPHVIPKKLIDSGFHFKYKSFFESLNRNFTKIEST